MDVVYFFMLLTGAAFVVFFFTTWCLLRNVIKLEKKLAELDKWVTYNINDLQFSNQVLLKKPLLSKKTKK